MELTAVDGRIASRCSARDVGALKARAYIDRSRCIHRAGEETLGTPQEQVMTDQEVTGTLLTRLRSRIAGRGEIPVFSLKEITNSTNPIRTNAPGDAGHKCSSQALTDGVGAGVKERLPGRIAVILDTYPVATVVRLLPLVDVTEPGAKLEHETLNPLVL